MPFGLGWSFPVGFNSMLMAVGVVCAVIIVILWKTLGLDFWSLVGGG